jgi:hypothetical protein
MSTVMVTRGGSLSDEQKLRIAAGRVQAKERKRIIGFPVGAKVIVRHPPARGYDGRVGTVSEHLMGEVGVQFTTGSSAVWFMPDQLVRVKN